MTGISYAKSGIEEKVTVYYNTLHIVCVVNCLLNKYKAANWL